MHSTDATNKARHYTLNDLLYYKTNK